MMSNLSSYVSDIERIYAAGGATEHSYRPALQALVQSLERNITALNEPRRIAAGAPDFRISRANVPIGYIETKDIGLPLDRIEDDEQLTRYRRDLSNLILTDYLEFRWYVGGKRREVATLGTLQRGKVRLAATADKAGELLASFIKAQTFTVTSPKDLAERMVNYAYGIRNKIIDQMNSGSNPTLLSQFEGFKAVLLHDLNEQQFADMYAQTVCYGLFAACLNREPNEPFDRKSASDKLPHSNPFLREFFNRIIKPDLDDMPFLWQVDDLVQLLAHVDVAAILQDFGKETRREDPVFHFYETFLDAYDPALREGRGVYYTPEPVVSYIVRSVHHLLKTEFGLAEGLADTSSVQVTPAVAGAPPTTMQTPVIVLDPAAGTGTFLHEVIKQIWEEKFVGNKGAWRAYVPSHLLPRLFGFELLMAPYTIAHIKLDLQLKAYGYEFRDNDRLNVYLTNALEERVGYQQALFAKFLADEVNAASAIKRHTPVMVILGNPPYSGHSANKLDWIKYLLRGQDVPGADEKDSKATPPPITAQNITDSYFHVDGQPLGERNPKWLNDDYVKFIRFAQWRIQRTGKGILAYISNNGYLDNPTFRGMRESLLHTFDEIYILNLHGNSKKRERSPDGSPDENVFYIQQGVAIGIFIKHNDKPSDQLATVYHADLYGSREVKYQMLNDSDISITEWAKLVPQSPFYVFTQQDIDIRSEYEGGWGIPEIMPVSSVGIVTSRDNFVFDSDEAALISRISDFLDPNKSDENVRENYLTAKDKLPIAKVRKAVHVSEIKQHIYRCLYRPFDVRYLFYRDDILERSRREVMSHMLAGKNIGLVSARSNKSQVQDQFFCSAYITEAKSGESTTQSCLFPLYLYPSANASGKRKPQPSMFDAADSGGDGRRANLNPDFIKAMSAKLGLAYIPDGRGDLQTTFGPEDVFDYMYAVFHAPEYRRRYAEFLKIDFPRLPLTGNVDLFRALCGLGSQLVALHLLDHKPKSPASYPLNGSDMVEAVRYEAPSAGDSDGKVWINKQQYFAGVTPAVWEFQIGGYQVAEKWLKDRKGRKLDYDDIEHYRQIIAALGETMRLMAEVDAAIEQHGGWPIK